MRSSGTGVLSSAVQEKRDRQIDSPPHPKRLKTLGDAMESSESGSSGSKTIKIERGAEQISFDREELVRLLAQCLGDLGYSGTALSLETESGIPFQEDTIANFRSHILAGAWDEAEAAIPSLELPDRSIKAVRFLLGEQRYLELLEKGEPQAAVETLRRKLTPLEFDASRLHTLTGLVMCKSPEELRRKASWSGTGTEGRSRAQLIGSLQGHIPPALLIPQNRLLELLGQAREQRESISNPSLTPYALRLTAYGLRLTAYGLTLTLVRQAREHQLSNRLCCNSRDSRDFSLLDDDNFKRNDVPVYMREAHKPKPRSNPNPNSNPKP